MIFYSPPANDNYEYTTTSPPPQPQQSTMHVQPKPQATSTATRELDELMATLSGFKVLLTQALIIFPKYCEKIKLKTRDEKEKKTSSEFLSLKL